MTLTRLVAFNSVVYLLFGVACIAQPLRLADFFGMAFNPGSMLLGELFGLFAVGFGLVLWRLRSAAPEVLQLLALPLAGVNSVGFVVYLMALTYYPVGALGWAVAAVQCFFALAYGGFALDRGHLIRPVLSRPE